MFKVGDEIDCVITEIDKEKRRVAISHRLTIENPFEVFEKKYPIGSEVEGGYLHWTQLQRAMLCQKTGCAPHTQSFPHVEIRKSGRLLHSEVLGSGWQLTIDRVQESRQAFEVFSGT